ncbi:MAG: Response regulator receiver domain [Acidimicrobiaceae bacterium]
MRRRVVIVDDDEISRRGMAEVLADRPEIEVVGTLTHGEAVQYGEGWDDVDVAVVDAADDTEAGDQFPGVAVVEQIRRRRSREQCAVIVITGHFFDDAVRRRMREACADLFYHRSELRLGSSLQEAVLHPDRMCHEVPSAHDHEAVFRLGLTSSSRVNDAVAYASEHGLNQALSERSGRSRVWARQRKAFNDRARLSPTNADGRPPERAQREPSLPQIERFLRWATRVKPNDD